MKTYIDERFLLQSDTAYRLYHGYACNQPVIDYHCHIDPMKIAVNHCFQNIAQLWLSGDHYKWRLMRANGAPERCITGDAPDQEKFFAFVQALERAPGNPVYHWTHLELLRYFGYDQVLCQSSMRQAWDTCNAMIAQLPVRELIARSRVEIIVTTDDPIDNLDAHRLIAEDTQCKTRVLPGWRPDASLRVDKPDWQDYISHLSRASGVLIWDLDTLFEALSRRMDFFAHMGCRTADHGLDAIPYQPDAPELAQQAMKAGLSHETVTADQALAYQTAVLLFLAREYARRGWVMQLHYGALRNANTRMFHQLGPDTGFDCMRTGADAGDIAGFLDRLATENALPKTILYSLNPHDNAMLTSLIGCFQADVPGKLQHGSAWWFNDTQQGMCQQLENLANHGLLGNFIGMLTDSRSFLSYTRHEYFRRILCNLLGTWIEQGLLERDIDRVGRLVEDIAYHNAKRYFGF